MEKRERERENKFHLYSSLIHLIYHVTETADDFKIVTTMTKMQKSDRVGRAREILKYYFCLTMRRRKVWHTR